MKKSRLALAFLLAFLLPRGAQALPAQATDYLRLGLDARAWLSPGLAVGHVLAEGKEGEAVLWAEGGITLPVLALMDGGLGSFEAQLGLGGRIGLGGAALIDWSCRALVAGADDVLGQVLCAGIDLQASPRFRLGSVLVGPDIGLRAILATHYSLSDTLTQAYASYPGSGFQVQGDFWRGPQDCLLDLGLGAELPCPGPKAWTLEIRGGYRAWLGSLVPAGSGFSLGEWPFYAKVQACLPLGKH